MKSSSKSRISDHIMVKGFCVQSFFFSFILALAFEEFFGKFLYSQDNWEVL